MEVTILWVFSRYLSLRKKNVDVIFSLNHIPVDLLSRIFTPFGEIEFDVCMSRNFRLLLSGCT